jgi:hypothetical protein
METRGTTAQVPRRRPQAPSPGAALARLVDAPAQLEHDLGGRWRLLVRRGAEASADAAHRGLTSSEFVGGSVKPAS